MRKTFIFITLIFLMPFYSKAQSSFEVQYDTLNIYSDGYFYVLNGLVNKTTSPLTFTWKVSASNFPTGVQGTVCICDNMNCHKDSTALFSGVSYESVYPSGFGELHLQADMTAAASPGDYYFQIKFYNKYLPTDSATQTYIIHKGVTAVARLNTTEDITVFPNPASKYASLSFNLKNSQQVQLRVLDITGHLAYSIPSEEKAAGKCVFTLPADELAPGIYNIIIKTEEGTYTKRMNIIK